jgi:hypothetical protein
VTWKRDVTSEVGADAEDENSSIQISFVSRTREQLTRVTPSSSLL